MTEPTELRDSCSRRSGQCADDGESFPARKTNPPHKAAARCLASRKRRWPTRSDGGALYTYENTLVVLEVTGQQLKDALEHSAKYFLPYQEGKTPAELINEKI